MSRRTPERKRRWRTKRRRRWKWKEPEEDFELVLVRREDRAARRVPTSSGVARLCTLVRS